MNVYIIIFFCFSDNLNLEGELIRMVHKLFDGNRNCKCYHIVSFEEFNRCSFAHNNDFLRALPNELDCVYESKKRISFLQQMMNKF